MLPGAEFTVEENPNPQDGVYVVHLRQGTSSTTTLAPASTATTAPTSTTTANAKFSEKYACGTTARLVEEIQILKNQIEQASAAEKKRYRG